MFSYPDKDVEVIQQPNVIAPEFHSNKIFKKGGGGGVFIYGRSYTQ